MTCISLWAHFLSISLCIYQDLQHLFMNMCLLLFIYEPGNNWLCEHFILYFHRLLWFDYNNLKILFQFREIMILTICKEKSDLKKKHFPIYFTIKQVAEYYWLNRNFHSHNNRWDSSSILCLTHTHTHAHLLFWW